MLRAVVFVTVLLVPAVAAGAECVAPEGYHDMTRRVVPSKEAMAAYAECLAKQPRVPLSAEGRLRDLEYRVQALEDQQRRSLDRSR